MRAFGEVGVIKKIEIQKKLDNKETDRIMLGYTTETEKGVYRILNLSTEKIKKTKNIEWLNMKYGEYCKQVLDNQEDNDTESMSQVTNKISNTLSPIKKVYSPSKIEEHLIKEMEKVDEETDSETLIQEDKKDGSMEIPDMPESED